MVKSKFSLKRPNVCSMTGGLFSSLHFAAVGRNRNNQQHAYEDAMFLKELLQAENEKLTLLRAVAIEQFQVMLRLVLSFDSDSFKNQVMESLFYGRKQTKTTADAADVCASTGLGSSRWLVGCYILCKKIEI